MSDVGNAFCVQYISLLSWATAEWLTTRVMSLMYTENNKVPKIDSMCLCVIMALYAVTLEPFTPVSSFWYIDTIIYQL